MSDSPSYRLNDSQQQVWKQLIGELPRGGQAKLAKALRGGGARHQSEATWKNALTQFFKGDKDGLKKIFEEPKALAMVAEALGRTSEQLQTDLQTASGTATEDARLVLRLPGFEDLGALPVLEAFFAPERGEVTWSMPAHQIIRSEQGGLLDLASFLEALEAKREDLPLAIVFVAEPGLGKTPTLEALAAKLVEREEPVVWWPQSPSEDDEIIVQDDLDRLPLPERARLLAEVSRTHATLVATSSALDPLDDLPCERVVARLRPYQSYWGVHYIEHLERALKPRYPGVDLRALRDWLEDDPYASALASRLDTLGSLARHVVDGGKVPVRHADVLRLALERWERLLQQRGRRPKALTLRLCGAGALGRVVSAALRAGVEGFTLTQLARAFVAEATGIAGSEEVPWGALRAPGMLTVVDDLVEVGMLQRGGDLVRLVQTSLVTVVLGHELARQLEDRELVRAIVLEPARHDALLVAAEVLGDPSPVISAIELQPDGVRCMAFPALTRLLSASPPPSDVEQLDRVFRQCLRWWIHWPASPKSFTMVLGAGYRPASTPPEYQRVANLPPLVAMGLASKRHQGVLRPMDVQAVLATPLGETIERYLELMGSREVDHGDARVALLVGAPYQTAEILDGALWRELPPFDRNRALREARVLQDEDHWFWWRLVAAPRLEKERDGKARIAGTSGGMSIASSMWTTTRGEAIWRDALLSRILARDPHAPAAFGEGVALTLERGLYRTARGIRSLWDDVPVELRAVLREAAMAAIPMPPDPWRHTEDDEWMTWMLRELVDESLRRVYWDAWIAASTHRGLRVPWRSFYQVGHPVEEIVAWALRALSAANAGPMLEPVQPQHDHPAYLALAVHETEPSPQKEALRYFLRSEDADALSALVRLDHRAKQRQKALERLSKLDLTRARRLVLELASNLSGDERIQLLSQIPPAPGEEAYWQAFADSSQELLERLFRLVQADCAADEAGGWRRTRAVLCLLDTLAAPSAEELESRFRDILGTWVARSAAELKEDIGDALPAVLRRISAVLLHARTLGHAAVDAVVRVALEAEHIRERIIEQPEWWWLAGMERGPEQLVTMLEQAHVRHDGEELVRRMLYLLTRHEKLQSVVLRVATHPPLRDAAAPVAAAIVLPARPAVARDILRQLPLVGDSGEPAQSTSTWIRHWAAVDGAAAVDWLRGALVEQAVAARRPWWQELVSVLPPGTARADAIEEWVACSIT